MLIQGGTVYDGLGSPALQADILIEDERIVSVGAALPAGNAQIVKAHGRIVCPGFVDIHRHADLAMFTAADFGETEKAQGITAMVVGNCGMAPVPSGKRQQEEYYRYIEPVIGTMPRAGLSFDTYQHYSEALSRLKLPFTIGFLAGAGAIKTAVRGFAKGPFSREELAKAAALVQEALEQGAKGLSFGIMYQPECYSSKAELVAMARPVGRAGKIICAHIRGEGDSLVESVQEMIDVASQAGAALNISHFKATGIRNWRSLIFRAIERIEAARAKGQPVTADFYPYDGGSTTLLSLIPPALFEESTDLLCAKLATAAGREELRKHLSQRQPGWDNMVESIGWDRILIASTRLKEHEGYCGKSMRQIAEERSVEPLDLLADLVAAEGGGVGIIVLSMSCDDIDTVARLAWTALISDSLYGAAAKPHPRLNGAFPKFLRDYVRERGILSMQEAIHKMTRMPAERLGFTERGAIKAGYYADLLVFDPERFTDRADYLHSTAHAEGMDLVIMNGKA
jgi:N-acyl-D-aspartate/D-glutamate deacylase